VEPDALRRLAVVEIGGDRFGHLLLKIAQVFTLRGNFRRCRPGRPTKRLASSILRRAQLEADFVHRLRA
jgi:hypothetical protein